MRGGIALIVLFGVLLNSCSEEQTPYTETVLYRENFDAWDNWERQPNSGGFTADSCVIVEDGLLKMTRKSGINGCGGTWVGIIIRDTNSYRQEFLENIGIRVKLNKGVFNTVERYIEGNSGGRRIELSSWMMLRYNKYFLTVPAGDIVTLHSDSSLEQLSNRIVGSEFEFMFSEGSPTLLVDGNHSSLEKIWFSNQSGVNQYLRIEFRVGHQPEFNPMVSELFIDEIEIYTWCGERD